MGADPIGERQLRHVHRLDSEYNNARPESLVLVPCAKLGARIGRRLRPDGAFRRPVRPPPVPASFPPPLPPSAVSNCLPHSPLRRLPPAASCVFRARTSLRGVLRLTSTTSTGWLPASERPRSAYSSRGLTRGCRFCRCCSTTKCRSVGRIGNSRALSSSRRLRACSALALRPVVRAAPGAHEYGACVGSARPAPRGH